MPDQPVSHSETWGQPPDAQPRTPAQRARDKEERMGEVGRRKIQVPRRTAQQVESVAISLEEAIKHLQEASDTLRPYSARMHFKAGDLSEQTTALRRQVLELGGDLEVIDG